VTRDLSRPFHACLSVLPYMCMFGIGLPELIIILIVALLVVGPTKLPEVARSIGKALGDFRRMADDLKDTLEQEISQDEEKKSKGEESPTTSGTDGNGGQQESAPATPAPDEVKKEASGDEASYGETQKSS
jgi:sec-independent protein translocase protein TatB